MQTLRTYLRTLSRSDQEVFAKRAGTTIGYLRKAISTRQVIGEKTCARLEAESGGSVTRCDLRPDDWQVIWPELCETNPTTTPATPAPAAIEMETVHG